MSTPRLLRFSGKQSPHLLSFIIISGHNFIISTCQTPDHHHQKFSNSSYHERICNLCSTRVSASFAVLHSIFIKFRRFFFYQISVLQPLTAPFSFPRFVNAAFSLTYTITVSRLLLSTSSAARHMRSTTTLSLTDPLTSARPPSSNPPPSARMTKLARHHSSRAPKSA